MEEPNTVPSEDIPEPEEAPEMSAEKKPAPYTVMSGFQSVLSIAIRNGHSSDTVESPQTSQHAKSERPAAGRGSPVTGNRFSS